MSGSGNELAVRDAAALAIQPGQVTWDKFQDAALNQLGLRNASSADKAVFLHQCQRTGLDPFAKQIMMIERREKQGENNWVSKWTIQTGIEGWRTIRDRAERREGLRGIPSRFTYYDHDDNERKVWTRPEPPAVVEFTYTVVEAGGREVPYTSQLRFAEYVQTKEGKDGRRYPVAQWATKPVHMLEKCTEADVYRKAFPQDYAGIDLADAMLEPDYDAPPAQPGRQRVTASQARERVQVRAEVVDTAPSEDPSPAAPEPPSGPAVPPSAEAAAGEAPVTEATWAEINQRLEALGVDGRNRARVASQIAGKPMKDATEADGRKVAGTLEGLDPAGLDGLLADRLMETDPRKAPGDGE